MNAVEKTLETLTDTAIDSAKGYDLAAEKATNPGLQATFRDQAVKRRRTIADLNAEIARIGGTPRDHDGTALGDLHRVWTRIADSFADGDKAAVGRVEEGEDYIRDKFDAAIDGGLLNDEPLTLAAVKKARAEIAEGERLSDMLEDRYEKAA